MKLYHGSNVEVAAPRLLRSDRRLDFGPGFYATSSYEQAARWAALTARRRKEGAPIVSCYDFDETKLQDLRVLSFPNPDSSWLEFVGRNRRGESADLWFDLVIGPVANDVTMPTLKLYFAGVYTEEETIRRLLPQKPKDQYTFKTDQAIDLLVFAGTEAIS